MQGVRSLVLAALVSCACGSESAHDSVAPEPGLGSGSDEPVDAAKGTRPANVTEPETSGAHMGNTRSPEAGPAQTTANSGAAELGVGGRGNPNPTSADGAGGSDCANPEQTSARAGDSSVESTPEMNGQTSDVDALDAGANSGPTASEPSGVEAGPASTHLIPVFPIALPRLPQNCVREVDYADAQSCGLHTSCDDYDANNVDCAVYDDGTWGCACTTNHYSYEFSVSGAEGAAACEVASEACGKGDRHDTSQPVTCDLTSPNPDADYCYMTQDCTRSVALDSEVSLSFSAEHSIYCAGTEGAVTCECGDDPSLPGVDFQLSSTNAADGCELTAALCSADVIAFDGPKDCKDPEVGSDGDCDITRECKQWNEDESIAVTTHDSALCSSAEDGSWSCECDTRDYTLSFGFAVPANLDDQCHTALDVCADAKQIELLPEPARCLDYELTAQAEEGTGCDGRLTCERDASFGDQGIVVYGDIQIACVPVGANGWRCSCYTPVRSVDVTIGTPMVRSDACSLAAEQCPRVIDAQFGITSKLPQENMPI